jgi:hypothetical protein
MQSSVHFKGVTIMETVEIDLVIRRQLVRFVLNQSDPEAGWRCTPLRPLQEGRFTPQDPPSEAATPEEALCAAIAQATRGWFRATFGSRSSVPAPCALPATTTSVEPEPVPSAAANLTRADRASELTRTIDDAIARLAEQLSRGHTEEFLATMAFYAKFWRYSFANLLLIKSQCPQATQVAGVRRWNELGFTVAKGQRAIWIWFPITKRELDPDTGELEEVAVGFRPGPVFDASQLAEIDEKPLPELFAPLPDDVETLYRAVVRRIETAGIVVEERPLPSGVQGVSLGGLILIRPGLDSRNRLFTLLHELAHELGHKATDEAKPQTLRELEAEATAYVVARALGLEIPTSRDYVLSWRGSAVELKASMQAIQGLVRASLTIVRTEDAAVDGRTP